MLAGAGILRSAPASQQAPMLRRHSWSTHGLNREALGALSPPAPGVVPASPPSHGGLPGSAGSREQAGGARTGAPPHREAGSTAAGSGRGGYLQRLSTHHEAGPSEEVTCCRPYCPCSLLMAHTAQSSTGYAHGCLQHLFEALAQVSTGGFSTLSMLPVKMACIKAMCPCCTC